jgi:hypothetical protein
MVGQPTVPVEPNVVVLQAPNGALLGVPDQVLRSFAVTNRADFDILAGLRKPLDPNNFSVVGYTSGDFTPAPATATAPLASKAPTKFTVPGKVGIMGSNYPQPEPPPPPPH